MQGPTAWLAEAQEREGAIVDALETVEQALQANPDELVHRPEALSLRGALQLKQEQTELAEEDFREAVALAHTMVRCSIASCTTRLSSRSTGIA